MPLISGSVILACQRRAAMPCADEMLAVAASRRDELAAFGLGSRPRRKLAVLACMDTRMDLFSMLGLARGDAHIIRNAGGLVTDDALRSLSVSQRLLGTEEIVVVMHDGCEASAIARRLERATANRSPIDLCGYQTCRDAPAAHSAHSQASSSTDSELLRACRRWPPGDNQRTQAAEFTETPRHGRPVPQRGQRDACLAFGSHYYEGFGDRAKGPIKEGRPGPPCRAASGG